MALKVGGGGENQAKNVGCKRGSLNKFLQELRSLLHRTIHLRVITLVYHPIQLICLKKTIN